MHRRRSVVKWVLPTPQGPQIALFVLSASLSICASVWLSVWYRINLPLGKSILHTWKMITPAALTIVEQLCRRHLAVTSHRETSFTSFPVSSHIFLYYRLFTWLSHISLYYQLFPCRITYFLTVIQAGRFYRSRDRQSGWWRPEEKQKLKFKPKNRNIRTEKW